MLEPPRRWQVQHTAGGRSGQDSCVASHIVGTGSGRIQDNRWHAFAPLLANAKGALSDHHSLGFCAHHRQCAMYTGIVSSRRVLSARRWIEPASRCHYDVCVAVRAGRRKGNSRWQPGNLGNRREFASAGLQTATADNAKQCYRRVILAWCRAPVQSLGYTGQPRNARYRLPGIRR